MKEMEKMSYEPDAVKENNFSTHFSVKGISIIVHFAVYGFGGDEDVIVIDRKAEGKYLTNSVTLKEVGDFLGIVLDLHYLCRQF